MFMAYQDTSKKRCVLAKLDDAISRYREKFDEEPQQILCSAHDLSAFVDAVKMQMRDVPVGGDLVYVYEHIPIQAAIYIQKDVFYIGKFDPPEEEIDGDVYY